MVRPVDAYAASDGTLFGTESECRAYETDKTLFRFFTESAKLSDDDASTVASAMQQYGQQVFDLMVALGFVRSSP